MLTERKISLTTKAQVALGVVCLLCGIGIYLLFRSESIRLYQWCDAVGVTGPIDMLRQETLQWRVPEFVRYSLPDGLYCCSYILLMDAVWKKGQALPRILASTAIPLVAVIHELLQGAGLVRGTFDWADLLCYLLPPVVYLMVMRIYLPNNN